MRRLLFAITTNLGWRIIGERLRDVIDQSGAAGQHVFEPFTLPKGLRHVTWTANYSESEGVPFPLLDPHLSFFLASRRLRRRAAAFDAVVAATSPMAAAFVADASSRPVFQIVDGTRDLFRRDFGITNISDAAIEREREHFLRVRHTFALSNWVRTNIVDVYGVAREKVSVIRPMAPVSASAMRIVPRLPPSARMQVAFVGGDFLRKGGDRLLEWHKQALHPLVDLHLVTDDRFRDDSVPNTHWYGSLSNRAVVEDLLPGMDLLCHPTSRDCSAIVVAEAAIVGVPSITTNVGGIPDLIEHGRTGYLFEIGDDAAFVEAIIGLSRSPETLARMKAHARHKARAEFAAETVFASIVAQVHRSLGEDAAPSLSEEVLTHPPAQQPT